MKASFFFNILGTIADNLSALIEFTPYKNKSVKLPFVTKDSKHLMGPSGDDSSALIEFTPLRKTRATRTKQSLPAPTTVNVRTVSNLNSLIYSKTCTKN